MDEERSRAIVPTWPLATAAVTAGLAVAAIAITSSGVRQGPTPTTWSIGLVVAVTIWASSVVAWAIVADRPVGERRFAPAASAISSAAGPAALFVLAMPAVDHPFALGWLWIWSFGLAADGIVQGVATGRFPSQPWARDGATLATVIVLSVAIGRIDVASTSLLATGAVALAWLSTQGIRAAIRRQQQEVDAACALVEADERRRQANWIHDELLSELRLARLRLETSDGGTRNALAELVDIEHRVRLRQLDVELAAGGARLAEVVQPFVRMVTDAGCRIEGVPPAEVAGTWLDARTGYELKRFFGVAVPNALLAGATLVVLEVVLDEGRLVVRVRDDAGGFDPERAPAGRGRERLERELGTERLTTAVDSTGTTFSCEFDVELRPPDA